MARIANNDLIQQLIGDPRFVGPVKETDDLKKKTLEGFFQPRGDPYQYKIISDDEMAFRNPQTGNVGKVRLSAVTKRNPNFLGQPEFLAAWDSFESGGKEIPKAMQQDPLMVAAAAAGGQLPVGGSEVLSAALAKVVGGSAHAIAGAAPESLPSNAPTQQPVQSAIPSAPVPAPVDTENVQPSVVGNNNPTPGERSGLRGFYDKIDEQIRRPDVRQALIALGGIIDKNDKTTELASNFVDTMAQSGYFADLMSGGDPAELEKKYRGISTEGRESVMQLYEQKKASARQDTLTVNDTERVALMARNVGVSEGTLEHQMASTAFEQSITLQKLAVADDELAFNQSMKAEQGRIDGLLADSRIKLERAQAQYYSTRPTESGGSGGSGDLISSLSHLNTTVRTYTEIGQNARDQALEYQDKKDDKSVKERDRLLDIAVMADETVRDASTLIRQAFNKGLNREGGASEEGDAGGGPPEGTITIKSMNDPAIESLEPGTIIWVEDQGKLFQVPEKRITNPTAGRASNW